MNQWLSICPEHQKHAYVVLPQKLLEAQRLDNSVQDGIEWEKMRITEEQEAHGLECNVILVRHALAWHNYFKRMNHDVNRDIYCYDLMDPPLHYFGIKQCELMAKVMENITFDVVYVSPLLRAVQTAQLLFKNHPQKHTMQFILTPICSEKVSSQYSFYKWGNLQNLSNDINFDRSQIQDEFWQLRMLGRLDLAQGLPPTREGQDQMMAKFVATGKIALEDTHEAERRSQQFRKQLNPNLRTCIISHSVFIRYLFTERNIKLKNGSIQGIDLL